MSTMLADYKGVIESAIANHPRSQQKEIGPSEIGTDCARRIGYTLLDVPRTNRPDSWLATIGTAVHAWLADAFMAENNRLIGAETNIEQATDAVRWLIEKRVTVAEGLDGSLDLFDTWTGTVIDHKIVGDSMLKQYKAHGPSSIYRTQAHSYGLGLANEGYDVKTVAIAFVPRGGSLRGLHLWSEPFNADIANEAIERLALARSLTIALGVESLPLLPTAESHCNYCPWFLPGAEDPRTGCAGVVTVSQLGHIA